MTEISITPLHVPASLDADDAADFRLLGELGRLVCDEHVGLPDLSPSARELLTSWRDPMDTMHIGFVARIDGEVVGMVTLAYAQEKGAETAEIDVLVPRAHAGLGIEQALLTRAEADASARGRSIMHTWTPHLPREEDRMLVPATDWGRVPATPLADIIADAGYSLEQVERNSEYDLHSDDTEVRRMLAEASAFAGPDYRVREWNAPTPPELRDGYAAVLARLSTDAPSGDMDFVAEQYDAARVERRDARLLGADRLLSVVAIEHVPTGELVAYNELMIGADRSGVTHQFGTLVAAHHRGRRLGMIVKCANLLRWREQIPTSRVVSTFNAEENRPMLDINEAIGFVPVSYAGAWQKRI